jgi:2-methylcitrate dehydratase PrpD
MCRIGLAVPGRFHARHFHPTSLTAGFAAALVAGKLGGLTEDQLVNALGICGSQAGGIIEYLADGTWTKRLHPGWAAHAGVVATRLAASGFTGPERVFEGEHGFYAAFAGGHDAARLEAEIASLGRTWEILNLTYKPYPAGSIAHPYMDCAARLREKHALVPETIAEIRCRTASGPVPRLWEPLAAKHKPANGYAAKFSLPYLLASVLVRGTAGLADFTDDAVRDERVLAVAGRVGYDLDPTIDYPRQFVGDVRIRLLDGRVLEERQDHPRGGPDFPLHRRDLEAKFRGNAALALAADAVERAVEDAGRLATLPHVAPLMDRLTGRTSS